jgi:hypothetical protein
MNSSLGKGRKVVLCGRVVPHLGVHCGGREHRGQGGQKSRRHHVVGESGRHLGQDVGGGRRHDHEVCAARELHVRYKGARPVQVGDHRVAAERGERLLAHETAGRLGHCDADIGAHLGQQPGDVDNLVCGDPAGDTQDDLAALDHLGTVHERGSTI